MAEPFLMQYNIFLAIAPVTIVLLVFIFGMIFRVRRSVSTATPLLWICFLLLGFIVCNFLEQISPIPARIILFAKLTYLFAATLPVAWLAFALRYTGRDEWFGPRLLIFLLVLPVVTNLLVFTNELHGLIWREIHYVPAGNLIAMRVEHGFWFYAAASYNYVLFLAGALMIFAEFLRSPRIYKRQASWILAGALIPLIFNLVYVFHLIPELVKDYTCFGFFFSMVCFYIGIFRYRLLELLPIARAMIIEQMKNGLIILRSDMTIMDLNRQARDITGTEGEIIGKPFDVLESVCPVLFSACQNSIAGPETKKENAGPYLLSTSGGSGQGYFDIECIPLVRTGKSIGHLITLHDVTQQVRLMRRIEELAQTDGLTGLFNRRHFMEIFSLELDRCRRYKKPLSLAIMDIDHFKKVNDAYGHPAGDQVLAALGKEFTASLRSSDTVGRMGGEEFGMLLPEANGEDACAVCFRLKEAIAKNQFPVGNASSPEGETFLSVTVSIGVACATPDAAAPERLLFEQADKALYCAKNNGRNRVVLWKPETLK